MRPQLAEDISESVEESIETLHSRLDKASRLANQLLIELRKAMSDRNITAEIVQSLRGSGTVTLTIEQVQQAILAIENTNVTIVKRGGIHSRSCAIFPKEIVSKDWAIDLNACTQWTEKGPCDCGLVKLDADTNAVLKFLRESLQ